jgi:hypothetical protein
MEDCIGLKIVCDAVEGILREQPAPPHHSLTFVHTDRFEKEAGQRGKFQKPEFALTEFDLINRCSYFDYQRDRMSARSRRPPKTKPKKSGRAPSSHRNNKIVEVYASRCPVCRSKKLSPKRHLRRQIVDFKFSGAAVRRWVVLFLSQEYRCRKCNSKFIPAGFPTVRTKFGKGLVSWCMYQMFVGGQNMSRIRDGVAKLFGIEIDISCIYGFKQSITFRYRGFIQEFWRLL